MVNINLFPHILMRIGGGSFENLQRLKVSESVKIVDVVIQQKKRLDHLKQKICDDLFILIQSHNENPALQKNLLNFKRDVFNERNISSDRYRPLEAFFNDEFKKQFMEYDELKARIGSLKARGKQIFDEELQAVRKQLCGLAADEKLQKGLLLSSQSLLQSAEEYIRRNGYNLTKKEYKTEEGLIKYLSRLYAKTSPFSTFTNLTMARLSVFGNDHSDLIHYADVIEPRTVSHIRLNNFLYQYLLGLLIKNPDVSHRLLLRSNPTIQKNDDHYRFLTNSNNIEAFQRIPINPAIDVFLDLCSNPKEGARYCDLVRKIIDNEYIDAPKDAIEAFIDQLIGYGLLEYRIGVSGIDPDWDIKLCEQLDAVAAELPLIQDLVMALTQVREIAVKYADTELAERKSCLIEAHSRFRSICMTLHEAAGLPQEERLPPEEYHKFQIQKERKEKKLSEKNGPTSKTDEQPFEPVEKKEQSFKHEHSTFFDFRPEQMFYEDTTLDISPELNSEGVSACISSLNRLLDQMLLFEGHSDERDTMAYYFEQKYGRSAKIDLLTFYEDYYREYKKPEAERLKHLKEQQKAKEGDNQSPKNNPNDETNNESKIPKVRERQILRKQWQENLASKVKAETNFRQLHAFQLTLRHIEENNRTLTLVRNNKHVVGSFGAFVQFFEEKDTEGNKKIMGVLNASLPGFGKMFSRFLHVLEPKITDDLRIANMALSQRDILVEDCDASYFNANLHPPLMPYEIWIPNGHNRMSPEFQIPVMDLEVSHNAESDQLVLIHKPTGKKTYVFDLGFQGHGGRSQLFQLLEKFTLAEYLSVYPITIAVNSLTEPNANENDLLKKVFTRQRIIFDNWLILQRKTWFIPKDLLPILQPKESDWSYFERVNEWRHSYHIPDDVFIFVAGKWNDNISPEDGKKLGHDDRKPQYVSFKNPFLISLFASLIKKTPGVLRIEEMLPGPQQLNTIGTKKYVTEFVLQWYTSGNPS